MAPAFSKKRFWCGQKGACMAGHDIIVVGASAAGPESLQVLMSVLPPEVPAAVFVVVHIPSDSRSVLPAILCRAGPLAATHASDGEVIQHGHVYITPPHHHLVLERRLMRHNSPAVDVRE
jgi:two-component system, chemotaxis family, protein-glutamate methylesterase/glutaminase